MKTLLFLLLFSSTAFAQNSTYPVFTAKGFAKATTATDTSATLFLPYSNSWVNVVTTTTGSDSSVLYVNVDAYNNGVWNNSIIRDTLPLGSQTLATKGQIDSRFLRTAISDLIQNAYQIRIRNIHGSGSSDSTAPLTYTQNLITRQ